MEWDRPAGQPAGGRRAPRRRGFDSDPAAVQLGHPLGDGQPESGAAGGIGAAAESSRDLTDPLGGDAGAVVGDIQGPGRLALCDTECRRAHGRGDAHLPARRAVPRGVVQQVRDELGEPSRVGPHGQVGRRRHGIRDRARPDLGFGHGALKEGQHADLLELERRDSGVHAREVEQVGHEVREPLGLGQGSPQLRVVRGDDSVDEVLQEGALRGQRRAQLVRDGGDELAPLSVGGGQVVRHRVESSRESAHLVLARRGDLLRVVTRCHARGRARHLLQRGDHAARQPLGDRQGRGDGDRDGDPSGHPGLAPEDPDEGGGQDAGADQEREFGLDGAHPVEWPLVSGGLHRSSRA